MTALEKQVQAAEKRIAKYEKNVNLYHTRTDRHLAKLQKDGYPVTRDDFIITKDPKWKFSFDITLSDRAKSLLTLQQYYPVTDNLEYEYKNAAQLENERAVLDGLKAKLDTVRKEAQAHEANVGALLSVLSKAFEPYRAEWTRQMIDWHTGFYHRIHEMLPEARIRHSELQDRIARLYRENRFRVTTEIRTAESRLASYGRILSSAPVSHASLDSYLNHIRPELDRQFDQSVALLADKCLKYDINTSTLQVHHPRMAGRGFDVFLVDRPDRVVDARLIWAAEDSQLVTPHTRYIVTERSVPAVTRPDSRISDVRIYSGRDGGMFIRCCIDGQQQPAERLAAADVASLDDHTDRSLLASRYFKDVLDSSLENSRSVKR